MPEHSTITDPDIHEPKGISSAVANTLYVADGSGSGDWKTPWTTWWWNYDHSATTATELTSGVKTDLDNDASGAANLNFNKLPSATDIWDSSTNSFDWVAGGCSLGDQITLRVDLTYTTNSTNDGFALELDLADGESGEISLPILEANLDTSGAHRIIVPFFAFIGNSEVLSNPAKLSIIAGSAGDTVLLNGFYVGVQPTVPVFI